MSYLCEIFGYDPVKFKHMTHVRQKVMIELLQNPLSLSNIRNNIEGHSKSTIHKSTKKIIKSGLIEKDGNKVYHLTEEGRGMALMIAISTNEEIPGLDYKVRDHLAQRIENASDKDIFESEKIANSFITSTLQLGS